MKSTLLSLVLVLSLVTAANAVVVEYRDASGFVPGMWSQSAPGDLLTNVVVDPGDTLKLVLHLGGEAVDAGDVVVVESDTSGAVLTQLTYETLATPPFTVYQFPCQAWNGFTTAGFDAGLTKVGIQTTGAPATNFDVMLFEVTAGGPGQIVLGAAEYGGPGMSKIGLGGQLLDATVKPLTITVTPEPATLALLALGGVAALRRRR